MHTFLLSRMSRAGASLDGRKLRAGISPPASTSTRQRYSEMGSDKSNSIPITVFTGFLGAGKTSVILSLLPKLPKDYKVVLLKVSVPPT